MTANAYAGDIGVEQGQQDDEEPRRGLPADRLGYVPQWLLRRRPSRCVRIAISGRRSAREGLERRSATRPTAIEVREVDLLDPRRLTPAAGDAGVGRSSAPPKFVGVEHGPVGSYSTRRRRPHTRRLGFSALIGRGRSEGRGQTRRLRQRWRRARRPRLQSGRQVTETDRSEPDSQHGERNEMQAQTGRHP
jgi:hypothetical protein